jgi:hypothetical protein
MRKILINAFAARMSGASGYFKELFRTFGEVDEDRRYWICINSDV